MNTDTKIGFIGGGNMARSLVAGLRESDWDPRALFVAEPEADKREYFARETGINVTARNEDILDACDAVVLAVKPQILHEVLAPLADLAARQRPLFVSIVAGIRAVDIERWLGGDVSLVRAMPNTPALVRSGATGLYANSRVSMQQRDLAESLLRAVGVTVWLDDEKLLDPVTAISGSGPAYFLLMMEALEEAGVTQGLPREVSRLLVLETCLGTARLALESGEEPGALRQRVTSPGGTTERALKTMNDNDYSRIIARAVEAATVRARELAEMFGAKR